MATINAALGVDLDRHTGELITGWDHVLQCMGEIFATNFGERIMREWFGSATPRLLGQNLTVNTVVRFFSAVSSSIEQWEPRFRVTQIHPVSVSRDGTFKTMMDGDYRPLALIGNFTSEGAKRITMVGRAAQGLSLV